MRASVKTLLLAALIGIPAGAARAQTLFNCPSELSFCAPGVKSVVVTGSPALELFFTKIAKPFYDATGVDIYYVRRAGACEGGQQVLTATLPLLAVANHITTDPRMTSECCTFNLGGKADLWVSESQGADCYGGKLPAELRDFQGPIMAYTVVAPLESLQSAITLEEAYFVFGFGSAGYKKQTVAPWTDQNHFGLPGAEFPVQTNWAKFLHLPPASMGAPPGQTMRGFQTGSQERVISFLINDHSPGGIGLMSAQAYDGFIRIDAGDAGVDKTMIKSLAVQALKQKRAFYADSTSMAHDKRNVRDGRYPFWAPVHMIARADITGRVLNDKIEALIGYAMGNKDLPGVDVAAATVTSRLIPTCAMKVKRAPENPETGDLMPNKLGPGEACGCMMDELISRGSSRCTTCKDDSECSGGKTCGHGYCE